MNSEASQDCDKYKLVAELGRGPLGIVYQACRNDPRFPWPVWAVKVLHPHLVENRVSLSRLERAVVNAQRLAHPGIMHFVDYRTDGEVCYLVSWLVDDPSLAHELARRRSQAELFTLPETARFAASLASALDYAHAEGQIHGHLTPANIVFDNEGYPILTDFGLAWTVGGVATGTPAYMAPELAQCKAANADARSDIYALGVILYQMLSGRLPFEADTHFALLMKHVLESVPRLGDINPDIPDAVSRVISKSLSKDPRDRYPMAGDLARALRRAA